MLSPEKRKAIFDYIGLVGALIAIIDVLLRFLSGSSQFAEFRNFVLLVVLTVFILLELSDSTLNLFVPLKYSVPLLLLSLGVSLSFRSAGEITDTLLGGGITFLILLLIDRFHRATRKQPGFDQGTLLAAFVAGLYVRGGHVVGLIFLMFIIASLFYLPFILIRRIPLSQRVPVIPFLVLAAIGTTTPYYEAAEVSYRNLGHEDQISAIQQFIERAKKGDKTFPVPVVNGPEVIVSYDKNPLPMQRVVEQYRDAKPRLVFEFWLSLREERKYREATKSQNAVYAFRDLNTGHVFLVSPTYNVLEESAK